jgi:hypothetical protein
MGIDIQFFAAGYSVVMSVSTKEERSGVQFNVCPKLNPHPTDKNFKKKKKKNKKNKKKNF